MGKGVCPVCNREIRLTPKGKIWCHGMGDPYAEPRLNCPGWGKDPKGTI